MNKNFIILLIVVGAVVIFTAGGGAGVLYQTQKDAPQIEKLQALEVSVKSLSSKKYLSSKLIPSINFHGEVTNIEGRNITLSYMGNSTTVSIKDDAQIISFVQKPPLKKGDPVVTTQQKVDFSAIKKGDPLSINFSLSSDNKLEGSAVVILPLKGGVIQ